MPIQFLRITDFRNLSAVELTPCLNGINIIFGQNGSGKTSLLEAIYYLGRAKSFRTATFSKLIRNESEKFSLYSQLVNDNERCLAVGMERKAHAPLRLKIEEKEEASITEVAEYLPLRLIHSQSHHLFEAGPIARRKYMDWGLFYQNSHFLSCWRQVERIIKQRNQLLREKRPKNELDVWSHELVKHGLILDQLRQDYLQLITPIIRTVAESLLSMTDIDLTYHPGWDPHLDYHTALMQAYPQEYRSGHTQVGPHRADFEVSIQSSPVKHFLSRGQQKLLICAMIIAQGICLERYANKHLTYLLDDLPAELDSQSKQKLITLLAQQKTQVFVTAIDGKDMAQLMRHADAAPAPMFHVEQGCVTRKDS